MPDRDRQLIQAAMHYLVFLDGGSPNDREQFVAASDTAIRGELEPFLEELLADRQTVDLPAVSAEDQALVDRAAARFRERLSGTRAVAAGTDLREAERSHRLGLAALAGQLNLPVDLLRRIELRGVLPATIPKRLIVRLASAVGQPEMEVRRWLAAPGVLPDSSLVHETVQPYLIAAPPGDVSAVGVAPPEGITFFDALVAGGASDEQLEEWGSTDDLSGRSGAVL